MSESSPKIKEFEDFPKEEEDMKISQVQVQTHVHEACVESESDENVLLNSLTQNSLSPVYGSSKTLLCERLGQRICQMPDRLCERLCVPGQVVCPEHIGLAKDMPFTVCSKVNRKTGAPCGWPVSKDLGSKLCPMHQIKAENVDWRAALSTPASVSRNSAATSLSTSTTAEHVTIAHLLNTKYPSRDLWLEAANEKMLEATASRGGVHPPSHDAAPSECNSSSACLKWDMDCERQIDALSSDADSMDSDSDHPLKRADCYSDLELVKMAEFYNERYRSLLEEYMQILEEEHTLSYQVYESQCKRKTGASQYVPQLPPSLKENDHPTSGIPITPSIGSLDASTLGGTTSMPNTETDKGSSTEIVQKRSGRELRALRKYYGIPRSERVYWRHSRLMLPSAAHALSGSHLGESHHSHYRLCQVKQCGLRALPSTAHCLHHHLRKPNAGAEGEEVADPFPNWQSVVEFLRRKTRPSHTA